MLRTVHSILEIARIQSGTYERLWQDFDIAEMMAGMIDHTRAEARRRGLAFVFLSDQPSMTVRGDVESLRVAIAHLIDNAVKFTERGGIDIRLRQNEEGVVLSISDTGIGMSSDYLARLREPFSQESEGFTKKYQGIGLGMSIAIHHLEANAVRWELRSDVGVGTRIVLHFS
ncbi:MAG: HAMP domain-containing sensor histidine kinase [Bacteroidota bacterium]|nr:HAMP domain-containing sensor histidine kinase [Bacteroidota bacterium]